ncbi:MAG: carboxypeptidase regulatory-like domain-containing protein [Phycisphaeraceae bacterium]|nr:carboxypeptidase regulatory-like domain-containing protein [Phycisphaeraceae bacterium]
MRRTIVHALCVLTLGLGVVGITQSASAAAMVDPEPSRISAHIGGVVVDADRQTVPGASVQLVNAHGRVLREATTDREGQFRFRPVPPGAYIVRAAKEGVGRGESRLHAVRGRNLVRVQVGR